MAEGALPFYPENHQDTKFITENFLSTGDKIVLPVYGSNRSDEVYYMVNYDQILPDNIYSPGVYLHVENWKCLQLKVTNTAESELVSTEYSSCSNTKVVCMKPLGGGSAERSETTSTGAVSGQEVVASNNLNLQAWPYQATWTTANNTIKASIEFEWQTKTIITGLRVTWTRKAPVRILKLSHDHEDRIFRGHVPYHMGEGQDADIFLYGEDGPEDDLPQHPVFQIDLTRPIVTQKLVIELKDFHENAEVDLRLFHHDTEEFKYDTGASFNQGVCNLSSSFVSEWSGKCVKIIESSPVDLTGTDPRNHTLDVCHGNRGRLFVPKTLEELFKMRQLAFEYVTSNKLSLKVLLLPLKFDGQTWLDLEDEEPFLLGNIVENLNYNERNILYFDIERPWPTKPYSYLFDDELDIISDDFLFFCEVDGKRTCPFNSGGELERRCGQSPEPPAGFSAWGHPLVVHQDETLLQVYYSEDTRNAQHMYSTCSPWRECYRDRTGGIKCLDGGSFWTNIMRGEDCPDGIGFLGTCYVLLSTAADHFKSLKTCFDKRLVPVMPSNWRQHYFLQRLAASTDRFFLGYRAGNSFKPPATYNPVNLEGKEAMCIAWGSSTDDFEDSTWQFVGCKKQLPAVVCQVYEYKSLPSQVAWRAFPANGPLHYITRFGDAGSLPAASLFEWEEVCERYGARVLSLSSIDAMNQYADYLPDLPNYKIMWIGNLKDPTLGITVTAYGSEINVGAWGNNEWYITSKSKHRLVRRRTLPE
ncbi:uncharacterized protein [Panulirus ornatus]|uniref:uncharacterized protein n=1 Tax=Panulirus ornatus TaxID=150431 RepID=UPI003A83DEAA